MMTNLNIIAKLATEKHDETVRFGKFLRRFPSATLDTLVEKVNAGIAPQIDCKQCANCCKNLRAAAFENELPILADSKQISIQTFKSAYLQPYQEAYYFKDKPCPMLQSDGLCQVYDQRPICCQTFPNLIGEHFKYRFHLVIEKYAICPIVFNVVETLKTTLHFENTLS